MTEVYHELPSTTTSVLIGAQRPRIESVPPYVTTAADEAIEMAKLAGLALDEWQRHVLQGAMGQDAQGHWTAPEVGLVLPRQNERLKC